jgi:hypothetical protein
VHVGGRSTGGSMANGRDAVLAARVGAAAGADVGRDRGGLQPEADAVRGEGNRSAEHGKGHTRSVLWSQTPSFRCRMLGRGTNEGARG